MFESYENRSSLLAKLQMLSAIRKIPRLQADMLQRKLSLLGEGNENQIKAVSTLWATAQETETVKAFFDFVADLDAQVWIFKNSDEVENYHFLAQSKVEIDGVPVPLTKLQALFGFFNPAKFEEILAVHAVAADPLLQELQQEIANRKLAVGSPERMKKRGKAVGNVAISGKFAEIAKLDAFFSNRGYEFIATKASEHPGHVIAIFAPVDSAESVESAPAESV